MLGILFLRHNMENTATEKYLIIFRLDICIKVQRQRRPMMKINFFFNSYWLPV